MSHRDGHGRVVRLNSVCLKLALRWLLEGIDWSCLAFRHDCTWTPAWLARTALVWSWCDEVTLVERFQTARRLVQHLCPQATGLAGSYQAFTKMLRRWTDDLLPLVQAALRARMQRHLTDGWLILEFVMFGVDGSRAELPRTCSHERAYSAARHRKAGRTRQRAARRTPRDAKKANSPQLWLTTMWHAGCGLPWDWRLGPADSSERAHLLAMLASLPPGALIAADAGFVGYDYLRAIGDSGRELLLRVGSNVRLLKRLGYVRERHQTVYLWPDKQARQGQPPLVLRLVVAHNGKHPVYLVTSVLSRKRLTDAQVVELYARRWGIEVFYRHVKQTFQRRKLRSTSADNALLEMHWSLAGLWAMALYALVQLQIDHSPPQRLSIAQVLRAYRRMLRDYLHPCERGCSLRERLQTALIDTYQRGDKTSRDYPRKKQETPPGPPRILPASRAQTQHAQSIRRELSQKG